jgi:hypothetical protein
MYAYINIYIHTYRHKHTSFSASKEALNFSPRAPENSGWLLLDNLPKCKYTYIYIYIYTCIYRHIYINIHIYIYIYICMYAHKHITMFIYT